MGWMDDVSGQASEPKQAMEAAQQDRPDMSAEGGGMADMRREDIKNMVREEISLHPREHTNNVFFGDGFMLGSGRHEDLKQIVYYRVSW